MPANRYQLRGASLDDLRAQILVEHGPDARIVSAEKVIQGGVAGLFAKHFYEVTVEIQAVPEPAIPREGGKHREWGDRVGIAALLDAADAAETRMSPASRTTSEIAERRRGAGAFEEIAGELAFRAGFTGTPPSISRADDADTEGAAQRPAPDINTGDPRLNPAIEMPLVPELARGAGDLTLLIGVGQDVLSVAHTMSVEGYPVNVRSGGNVTGSTAPPVDDRRSAFAARADGVAGGRAVLVAFGIDFGVSPLDDAVIEALRATAADHVWVVVDATTKHDDMARWVRHLSAAVPLHALAVTGLALTSTPETVDRLGVPVGRREQSTPRLGLVAPGLSESGVRA